MSPASPRFPARLTLEADIPAAEDTPAAGDTGRTHRRRSAGDLGSSSGGRPGRQPRGGSSAENEARKRTPAYGWWCAVVVLHCVSRRADCGG